MPLTSRSLTTDNVQSLTGEMSKVSPIPQLYFNRVRNEILLSIPPEQTALITSGHVESHVAAALGEPSVVKLPPELDFRSRVGQHLAFKLYSVAQLLVDDLLMLHQTSRFNCKKRYIKLLIFPFTNSNQAALTFAIRSIFGQKSKCKKNFNKLTTEDLIKSELVSLALNQNKRLFLTLYFRGLRGK